MRISIIVDCSVIVAGFLREETDTTINVLYSKLESGEFRAVAPSLFYYEAANAFCMALRRNRITKEIYHELLAELETLPIETEKVSIRSAGEYAEKHSLSVYDASYLSLAITAGLPVATTDKALAEAALREGILFTG